ncbi:hypothetical protein C6N75_26475 [Streptomyces solincola]|uniref:Uncharacterized protein n=1 Tax=Streptomyces solincola TaxID=2100817 RepID=A0A2S9PPD1_9ACTN|nr:hypothetical protein [Streptomyces solincola]PRH76288.1 hypothetical protein C6N75_26475 [Streptomyces solincola]
MGRAPEGGGPGPSPGGDAAPPRRRRTVRPAAVVLAAVLAVAAAGWGATVWLSAQTAAGDPPSPYGAQPSPPDCAVPASAPVDCADHFPSPPCPSHPSGSRPQPPTALPTGPTGADRNSGRAVLVDCAVVSTR